MDNPWQLSIDTGGTFTDCVALSPAGITTYSKVLSSGKIGGRALAGPNRQTIKVTVKTTLTDNLFTGYQCVFPDKNWQSVVSKHDDKGNFTLQEPLPAGLANRETLVYLTANEEAPVLAARIATQTPLSRPLPPVSLRLGTTKGTNALLEGKGAPTALVVTRGFKDLLTIGTQQRPELFALEVNKRKTLPQYIIEVEEQISADGDVIIPLQEEAVKQCLAELKESACEAVAIAFKNSYLNPEHELMLARAIEQETKVAITCSARLYPAIKYLTRTETAVVNAYLAPVLASYFNNISRLIGKGRIRVMTSAGALAKLTSFNAKDSLLSGPAGGIVGAARAATEAGFNQVLTIDMGGTSTDVSRYDHGFDYQAELSVGDAHLFTQALAIETVAAGGGSICHLSEGRLQVGPESAGAYPGPACYGNNGPLSVTDLNLLAGRLDTASFALPLDKEAAGKKMSRIVAELNKGPQKTGVDELVTGFLSIANQKMADAVKKISLNKGFDPRDYALLGFGGAIGQHICDIAELLGITRVLVPYTGSLLSAVGISKAVIEKHQVRQMLVPLAHEREVESAIRHLQEEALAAIKADGLDQVEIKSTSVYMRLYGQDTSIETPYTHYGALADRFKQRYQELFGHWVERDIEVESIKVTVAETGPGSKQALAPRNSVCELQPTGSRRILYRHGWQDTPVYHWPEFVAGEVVISGPAVFYNPFTSIIINPGWTISLAGDKLIITQEAGGRAIPAGRQAEAVELALFTNRFKSVAEQMGSLLQRTALSVNIKERLDFSCALLDKEGRLVVNAPHIPVHLGSLGICTRAITRYLPLAEGDVVITNHPAFGGSHLPDVTLIAPVFYRKQLVGYLANRAHHAEIGGKAPGSMPADARNLAEEGVVIPPTMLVKKGHPDWQTIAGLLTNAPYPSRNVNDNMADFQAALAAIVEGQKAMLKLLNAHGAGKVIHYMQQLGNLATSQLTAKLDERKISQLAATEYLDDGSKLQVSIRYNDKLRIDFTGTAPANPGNLNATEAIVNGAVIYVLKLLIGGDIPLNEGLMEQVELVIPRGSLLNPVFDDDPFACPAVVGGNTEVSQRLVDTLLKALGLAACSQGTMNNFLFGNAQFGYYETICGGTGAGPGFNGTDAVHQHMTNTQITDAEVLEFRYPVRLLRFAVRKNSGGQGRWQGGNGVIREFRFNEPVTITFLAQHRQQAPYGLLGGLPGKVGEQYTIGPDGRQTALDGVGTYPLEAGERVVILTPGGGGYGAVKKKKK